MNTKSNKESEGKMTDYYELLEVKNTASIEVIRAAYKAGVKRYHPDNYTDEEDKNCYGTVKTPKRSARPANGRRPQGRI